MLSTEVIPTSTKGFSLLVIRKLDDGKFTPSVSVEIKTDIANYIKKSIETQQNMEARIADE